MSGVIVGNAQWRQRLEAVECGLVCLQPGKDLFQLKELEQENKRLKKLVADLTLDKDILKEALEGNW